MVKQSHYRPGQFLRVPGGSPSQISRQSTHEGSKVVSPRHRPPLAPRKYFWYSLLLGSSEPQGLISAGRIISMKNSSGTIGNQTRDLLACSAVTQPTGPTACPLRLGKWPNYTADSQLYNEIVSR